MSVLLAIDGEVYEVSSFVALHPGEGHNDIYLEDFADKDVSSQFEYYHADKQSKAKEWLSKARQEGEYKGIQHMKSVHKEPVAVSAASSGFSASAPPTLHSPSTV